jgi:RHS repeat-associated protein
VTVGAVQWMFGNHQASASITVADNTTVAVKNRYLPYGGLRGTDALTSTDHGFLDQIEDATGLDYLNARYLDPILGRFISVDPLVSVTGSAYTYGLNNPLTYSDPTGLLSADGAEAWATSGPSNAAGGYGCGATGHGPDCSPTQGPPETMGPFLPSEPPAPDAPPVMPNPGEEVSAERARSIVDYFGKPANWPSPVGNAAGGAAGGAMRTVYVLRGKGKDKFIIGLAEYQEDLGFLKSVLPKNAGTLEVIAGRVGKGFLVVDITLNSVSAWNDHPELTTGYRVGYTAVKTASVVAGGLGGAAAGGMYGASVGGAIPGPGTLVGGLVGGAIGGLLALSRQTT